jgi:hypothetical protein
MEGHRNAAGNPLFRWVRMLRICGPSRQPDEHAGTAYPAVQHSLTISCPAPTVG